MVYNILNESLIKDINFMKSKEISDIFTISFEIELETNDVNGIDSDYNSKQIDGVISLIRNRLRHEMKQFSNVESFENYYEFIDDVLYDITDNIGTDDDAVFDTLNSENYDDITKKTIVDIIEPLVKTYFYTDNIFYLKKKIKKHLPIFWNKWENEMKYEIDNSLDRGIEISMRTYINGLNESMVFINDFYNDFEIQNYWKFKQSTGIHINIGVNYKSKWNIIKGLLFLDDISQNSFVFRGMKKRFKSGYASSLKSKIMDKRSKDILNISDLNNIEKTEDSINEYLHKAIRSFGYKEFGFNITTLKTGNYVEFRYPGGRIKRIGLIEKLLYFCFIIYCMVNNNYKKSEYFKKLYKFLDQMS